MSAVAASLDDKKAIIIPYIIWKDKVIAKAEEVKRKWLKRKALKN